MPSAPMGLIRNTPLTLLRAGGRASRPFSGGAMARLGAALTASGRGLDAFTDVDLRFRDRVVFTLAEVAPVRR